MILGTESISNRTSIFRAVGTVNTLGLTRRSLFCYLLAALLSISMLPGPAAAEPLRVIFDTDMDGDNDDVAAAAELEGVMEELLIKPPNNASSAPLQLHPENPHYLLFRGKPTVLVTSGEHYGAVLNQASLSSSICFMSFLETDRSLGNGICTRSTRAIT